MNMKEKLLEKIILNDRSEEDIEKIISYRLDRYFFQEIRKRNKEQYLKIKRRIEIQKIKNIIFTQEVKRLASYFSEHNVRLIHLKGIVLAEDLYYECPSIRSCSDIDVLVAPEDTEKALDLLGKLGYMVEKEDEPVSAKLKETYYQNVITGGIHFPEFYVKVPYMGRENTIFMDFHIAITHKMKEKEKTMNEMVRRCEEQVVDGVIVQILEIHDRFLHLALHFTKEMLRNEMRWCIVGTRKVDGKKRLNLALLQDMALLINKYNDRINWDIVIERALEQSVVDEIGFVIRCLKWMYPDMRLPEIDNRIYDEEVYKNKLRGFFYPIQLIYMNVEAVMSKRMDELAELILKESENKHCAFYVGKKYYMNISFDNNVTGCMLSEKECDAIGTLEFLSGEDVAFRVDINNEERLSFFTFTIGSPSKNNIFNAYVNKFKVNLNELDTDGKRYSVSINNTYVQLKLYSLAELQEDCVEVHLPAEIIGQELIERGQFLFDIDFPEIYKDMELDRTHLRKFNLHSIAFPYNPDILQKIVI